MHASQQSDVRDGHQHVAVFIWAKADACMTFSLMMNESTDVALAV